VEKEAFSEGLLRTRSTFLTASGPALDTHIVVCPNCWDKLTLGRPSWRDKGAPTPKQPQRLVARRNELHRRQWLHGAHGCSWAGWEARGIFQLVRADWWEPRRLFWAHFFRPDSWEQARSFGTVALWRSGALAQTSRHQPVVIDHDKGASGEQEAERESAPRERKRRQRWWAGWRAAGWLAGWLAGRHRQTASGGEAERYRNWPAAHQAS